LPVADPAAEAAGIAVSSAAMSRAEGSRRQPPRSPDLSLNVWLAHLESLHPRGQAGIELGLERVLRVKEELASIRNAR
jgi:hypothetical protein